MRPTTRVRVGVVGLLGVVVGCVGASVGHVMSAPPIVVAEAQVHPTGIPGTPRTASAPTVSPMSTVSPMGTVSPSSRPRVAAPLPPFPPHPKAPRWQQHCVESFGYDLNMTAARYGAEGWELASADGYRTCFKRPAP